jgi:hypothetical protein
MEPPTCLHDDVDSRRGEVVSEWPRRVTTVWCTSCGDMLYEWDHNLETGAFVRHIFDDIYRLYHTNAGRKQLAIEALEARGWPIPEIWRQ